MKVLMTYGWTLTVGIILLVSPGCSIPDDDIPGYIELHDVAYRDTLDLLALGDSYTIGQGVTAMESWPYQLSRELTSNGLIVENLQIIAQTGWTTSSLLNALEKADLTHLHDKTLVFLMIGVNNQYQNLPFELFQHEFDQLVNRSLQIAGTHRKVFVISIPDYGVTLFGQNTVHNPRAISLAINEYNAHMRTVCIDLDISFIDVTQLSRMLGDSPEALSTDGLHPSGTQYEMWVELLLPQVLEVLIK